jgi:uncharacterized membrane protein (UPF0127 family)
MLFLSSRYPREERIAMWMASVSYALDMVWIARGRVVRIESDVQPGDPATYFETAIACLEMSHPNAHLAGVDVGVPVRIVQIT